MMLDIVFGLKIKFISIKELKRNIKIIEKLNVRLTLFELLTLIYYISASKLKNVSYALVEAGLLYAKDSTRVWDQPRCQIITNINPQHLEWVKTKNFKSYLPAKSRIFEQKNYDLCWQTGSKNYANN